MSTELDQRRRGLVEQAVVQGATGRLADPTDALRLLEVADLEVDADGGVDVAEVKARLDALLRSKPYLAGTGYQPPRALPGGGNQPAPPARGEMTQMLRDALRGHQ